MSGMRLAEVSPGQLVLVDARGQPVPPRRTITTTPEAIVATAQDAFALGLAAGRAETAAAVEATARAVVDATYPAFTEAGMKVGAEAGYTIGAKAGVQAAFEQSRVVRQVVRDKDGAIIGTVEDRVPHRATPPAEPPQNEVMK